jgi:DNA-binding beta-propeller fold protein YncE
VPAGARTIVLSPDGRYVFAACNYASCIAVVDTRTMTFLGRLPADSYPVGLDISDDGRYLFSTSQGRSGLGGNAVDIFEVTYL